MSSPQFRTSTNRLTPYSFQCGYIEKKVKSKTETTIWHEGAYYHVRQHDFENHRRVFWESFETLSEARNLFNRQKGKLA